LKLAESQVPFSADAQAIREIISRYTTFIDSGNYDGLRTIFTPDVEFENVHFHFRRKGIETILEFYKRKRSVPTIPGTKQHRVSNELVSISKEGDEAYASAYYHASVVLEKGTLSIYAGLFTFHLRKYEATWKVVDYKVDRVFDTELPNVQQRGSARQQPPL
jgi:ketosteroid isomerase-like protein